MAPVSLTLVTGPANAAKARLLLDAHQAAADRDGLLVVPNRDDAARFGRELAARGLVFGAAVLPVSALAGAIAQACGLHRRRVGPLTRERLLAAISAEHADGPLAASILTPGFPAALARLVAELQTEMVSPERLARAAPDAVVSELAGLYRAYRRRLERLGADDREGYLWRALDALRAAPSRWGQRPVFLYGFDDLTRSERDAVETLAGPAAAEVWVSLSFAADHRALEGRARTYQELAALATRERRLPALADHYEPDARTTLHGLERALFQPEGAKLAPTPAVALLEAGGERAEAELVGAWLLERLGEGFAPEELAVVVRAPERHASLLSGVLDAYRVPYALDAETPLGHLPLGRALVALLRCALRDDAEAGELVVWLRWVRGPGGAALADRLEAVLRRRGERTMTGARRELTRLAPGFPLADIERLQAAAARGPRALLEAVGRSLDRLLAAPRHRQAALLPRAQRPDARVHAAARVALEELQGLSGPRGAAPSPRELIDVLAALAVRPGDPPGPGRVTVCDPLRIRAQRYRGLVIAGLLEGELPRHPVADGLLDDARRWALAAAGVPLRPADDPLAAERALFYALVSRPTARLALAYRTGDEEGNPAQPSFFVDEVRRCFAPAPEPRRRPLADVVWSLGAAPTPAEGLRAAAAHAPRRRAVALGPATSPGARRALAGIAAVSPGSLECLAGCGVRWLVDRWLEPEALEPEPEPLLQGRLAHAGLEQALRQLAAEGRELDPDALPGARHALAAGLEHAAGEEGLDSTEPAVAALLRRAQRQGERLLAHQAAHGGGFTPHELEWSFGLGPDDAAALELAPGLAIHGRVDRIDVGSDGRRAAVVDYKGSGGPAHGRWAEDGRLQPALYMLAVGERLGLDPVAGLYQSLRDDLRPRGVSVDGEGPAEPLGKGTTTDRAGLDACLRDARDRALELVGRLRAGALHADPDCCGRDGCQHPGICRRGRA